MNINILITRLNPNPIKYGLFLERYIKKRNFNSIILMMGVLILLSGKPIFASIQQVFVDGQAGKFEKARSELLRLSEELEYQVTSADISIVGRNCAAIGFYSILTQISSDCITNTLNTDSGKKLFSAAQNAAIGKLNKAASIAQEMVDLNPNYLQAQLLLARIWMASCMQINKYCNEAIEIYKKALGIDNTLTVAYLDLGMLYQYKGKNQESIYYWEAGTSHAQGDAAIKFTHLMLALHYSSKEQWTKAKRHAEIAGELGFTGFAADALDEIQRHISSDSTSEVQELLKERKDEGEVTKSISRQKSKPDFMKGLAHGLTSPLRLFGFFDLHYEKKENWTDGYTFGLILGCLLILMIGLGYLKKNRN